MKQKHYYVEKSTLTDLFRIVIEENGTFMGFNDTKEFYKENNEIKYFKDIDVAFSNMEELENKTKKPVIEEWRYVFKPHPKNCNCVACL